MLKFENAAKVNDVIRAYDYKPKVGREDSFVEGVVISLDFTGEFKSFKIRITKHLHDGKEFTEMGYWHLGNRVGQVMYVPMELTLDHVNSPEYDSRIINLSS